MGLRKLVGITAAGILVLVASSAASGRPAPGGTVVRDGASYSGVRAGGCAIGPDNTHPTWLDVKCQDAGPAFIRYRILTADGNPPPRDIANVSADISTWVGEPCSVRWMVNEPGTSARTIRVKVPAGSYCDVRSVTWERGA